MVFKEEDKEKLMEGSKDSLPLLNFRWGMRKVMRCVNVNSNGVAAPTMMMLTGNRKPVVERQFVVPELKHDVSTDRLQGCRSLFSPVRLGDRSSTGIEALGKEILSDFQSAVGNMKVVFREGLVKEREEGDIPPVKPPTRPMAEVDGGAVRPWNLRTRRAGCKEPMVNAVNGGGSGGGNVVDGGRSLDVDVSRKPNTNKIPSSSNSSRGGQKRERVKFSCSLSRSEIEQDYFEMTGKRLPRRPHKWPKHVQEALQGLFPAMWLTDVSPDKYEVPELPENLKANGKIKIDANPDDYKILELPENLKANRKIKIKLRK